MQGGAGVTHLRMILIVVAILTIAASVVLIRRDGETSGAARVTATNEKAHAAGVAEARVDERAAAAVTASIAARTVRIEAKTDAYVDTMIKDMRDAIADVPPAAADAALPAAPVDRLRDSVNAGIDRANRAADAASAAP